MKVKAGGGLIRQYKIIALSGLPVTDPVAGLPVEIWYMIFGHAVFSWPVLSQVCRLFRDVLSGESFQKSWCFRHYPRSLVETEFDSPLSWFERRLLFQDKERLRYADFRGLCSAFPRLTSAMESLPSQTSTVALDTTGRLWAGGVSGQLAFFANGWTQIGLASSPDAIRSMVFDDGKLAMATGCPNPPGTGEVRLIDLVTMTEQYCRDVGSPVRSLLTTPYQVWFGDAFGNLKIIDWRSPGVSTTLGESTHRLANKAVTRLTMGCFETTAQPDYRLFCGRDNGHVEGWDIRRPEKPVWLYHGQSICTGLELLGSDDLVVTTHRGGIYDLNPRLGVPIGGVESGFNIYASVLTTSFFCLGDNHGHLLFYESKSCLKNLFLSHLREPVFSLFSADHRTPVQDILLSSRAPTFVGVRYYSGFEQNQLRVWRCSESLQLNTTAKKRKWFSTSKKQ